MTARLIMTLALAAGLALGSVACTPDGADPAPGTAAASGAAEDHAGASGGAAGEARASGADANEALATRYVEAYNGRDVDALEEILAGELDLGGEPVDRAALLGYMQAYWAAFPDLRLDPLRIVGAEDHVTVHVELEATGNGEYAGHDVDGRRVRASEMMLFRVRDGRIDGYWYEWDALGFWTQLGAVDDPMGG